jgi:hypothetical protein
LKDTFNDVTSGEQRNTDIGIIKMCKLQHILEGNLLFENYLFQFISIYLKVFSNYRKCLNKKIAKIFQKYIKINLIYHNYL